jgi:hypothetical protein
MSGGFFDYNQFRIRDIHDTIERCLSRMGKEKPEDELFDTQEYYEKYPEDKKYKDYSSEIKEILLGGMIYLRLAEIYAHRIDYFLSGDVGEEELKETLKTDLNVFKREKHWFDKGYNDERVGTSSVVPDEHVISYEKGVSFFENVKQLKNQNKDEETN